MIASMTAFGRTEETEDIGHILWEIRSVNHRYLEINTRLPEDFRILETTIREHISNRVKRGKIDCTLRFEPFDTENKELSLNNGLMTALIKSAEAVQNELKNSDNINPVDILRWPGVINRETPDPDSVGGPLLQQLDATLDILIETRQREGEKLKSIILERCASACKIIEDLHKKLPAIMASLRERLLTKAQELSIEIDNERLEQELLLLIQKHDVDEELGRLETHINEVRRVLESSVPVGRRLDFLMQELNREANTLGSKTAHVDSSNASVDLKVLIEQMREQVQNIE
jgi:uncharacterized protein (TIGR00255 family)